MTTQVKVDCNDTQCVIDYVQLASGTSVSIKYNDSKGLPVVRDELRQICRIYDNNNAFQCSVQIGLFDNNIITKAMTQNPILRNPNFAIYTSKSDTPVTKSIQTQSANLKQLLSSI